MPSTTRTGSGRPDRRGDDARPAQRSGGLGASAPGVARWLGDIRTYFPSSVVQVMQRDAVERLDLTHLLLEPELLSTVEPDVHLVGTLLSLGGVMPEASKATARRVVAQVVAQVEQRIAERTRSSVAGALDRSARTSRPALRDVDWNRTLLANLARYQPEHQTIVPERLVGYGRRRQAVQRDVILAVDQSGSMADSVVHASVFAAVLASMRTLRTSLVVFDTVVVDLTERLADPVDVLFGVQLGGGTDINRAIGYAPVAGPASRGHAVRADQRPVRGRRPRGAAQAGGAHARLRRPGRRPARAVRRRRTGVRPGERGGARGARRPGVRVHAGRLPGPARGRAAPR